MSLSPAIKQILNLTPYISLALWLSLSSVGIHAGLAHAASPCEALRLEKPRYHHILVLDLSGSVLRVLPQMQHALACYINMYAAPGEEVSVLVFGMDMQGSVKELRTFTVADHRTADIVNQLLSGIVIETPQNTRTYFKPVADFLNGFLHQVRLEPTLLVLSDGKSDARPNRQGFREIPFASLGTRGVYRLPGTHGWQIALAGGRSLDLSAFLQGSSVFSRPVTTASKTQRHPRSGNSDQGVPSVLDPCLVAPQLQAKTPSRLVLRPSWQPWRSTVSGRLTLQIQHDCVSRFRDFRVELRRGTAIVPIGIVNDALITEIPKAFSFDVSIARSGQKTTEAVVRLLLDQGLSTRTFYPSDAPSLTVVEQTYWQTFAWPISAWAVILVGAMLGVGLAKQRHRRREQQRPELIKIPGGSAVSLRPLQTVTIGGEGCQVSAPGLPAHTTLACGEWRGVRGELILHPGPSYRLQTGDQEATDTVTYQLGQPLLCINEQGESVALTIVAASEQELSLGTPVTAFSPATDGLTLPRFGESDLSSATTFSMPSNGSENGSYI